MTTGIPSGQMDQQFSNCPFCSLPYNQQTRTAIEPCHRCALPLLPANHRIELLDTYLRQLLALKLTWQETPYQVKVEEQILRVEEIQARLPKLKNRQSEVPPFIPSNEATVAEKLLAQVPASKDMLSVLEVKVQSLIYTCQALDTSITGFHNRLNAIADQVDQLKLSRADDPKMTEKVQALGDEFTILKAMLNPEQFTLSADLLGKISVLEKELEKEKEYRKYLEQHFSDRLKDLTLAFEKLESGQASSKAPVKPVAEPDLRHPFWMEQYHLSPQDIAHWAKNVEETPESFARRNGSGDRGQRNGKGAIVFVEQTRSTKYWIIVGSQALQGQKMAYLVPRPNIKFNIHEQRDTEAYFDFEGIEAESNGKYRLTRPAIVTVFQEEQWELVERGLLDFFV
jgi:predicted  nucleic acid-binding Zn-ribbon protein